MDELESPAKPPPDSAPALAAHLRRLAESEPELRDRVAVYAPGAELVLEGRPNDALFAVFEGEVGLFKHASAAGEPVRVSSHGPGDLLGVNSVATGKPAFTTARVLAPTRCLRLDARDLARLPAAHPEIHRLLQTLIGLNLAHRYRAAVRLQLELIQANTELTETRNLLVHREKMAVLGQLVAGLAHELNNPAAALARQRDHLAGLVGSLLARALPAGWEDYWRAGEAASPGDPEVRRRLARLETKHPDAPRSLLRRLAALPEALAADLVATGTSVLAPAAEARLAVFEVAWLLRAQQAAAGQISHLVHSLKTYARPSSTGPERVDLAENLRNTLLILGPALEHTELTTDLAPDLIVRARAGDLSQIWTNLVRNAIEAMGGDGRLELRSRRLDTGWTEVAVIDHGPGVPAGLRERIFELNFTTKSGREHFGLGLGLSIARSLAAQHGGTLTLADTPGGGSTFLVRLPPAQEE